MFSFNYEKLQLLELDQVTHSVGVFPAGEHLGKYLVAKGSQAAFDSNNVYGEFTRPRNWYGMIRNSPDVFLYEFHDTWLLGHGVLVNNEGKIYSSELLRMNLQKLGAGSINPQLFRNIQNEKNSYVFTKQMQVITIDEPCIPLSTPGEGVYGHWLVDILPRVVLSQMMGIKAKFILTTIFPDFAKKLLSLLGVKDEDIITYEAMEDAVYLKRIFFPSYLQSESIFSPIFNEMNRRFLSVACLRKKKDEKIKSRIFVSRGSVNERQDFINRNEIIEVAKTFGFDVVEPHMLTIEEQIGIFSEASVVMGEYGSALHNTVFSPYGSKVVVLQSESPPNLLQIGLGTALGHPTISVVGKSEPSLHADEGRSFKIDIDLLKKTLSNFL